MNRRDALRSILALPVVGPAVVKAAAAEAPLGAQILAPCGSLAAAPSFTFILDTTAGKFYRWTSETKRWTLVENLG